MNIEPVVFFHKIPVQIRFNDIDIVGHVNNTMYLHYYDLGRLKYLEEVLGDSDWKGNISLVVARNTIDYFNPVYLNNDIYVGTKILTIGNKSMELLQQVLSGKTQNVIHSQCLSVMVCVNLSGKTSAEIPEAWKERINRFEPSAVFKYKK